MRNLLTNDQDILFVLRNGAKEATWAIKKNLPRTSTYTLQEDPIKGFKARQTQ